MNKLISLLTAGLLMVSLTACSGGSSAKNTVNNYFAAAQKLDTEAMSRQILPSNKEAVEKTSDLMADDADEYSKVFKDYLKNSAAKMTYQIKDVKETGESAVVTVESKYVNGAPLIQAVLTEAISTMFETAFSGEEPTEAETSQLFTDLMKQKQGEMEETFLTESIALDLVRQDGKWYIKEVSDELMDVSTAGFISVFEGMGDSLGN